MVFFARLSHGIDSLLWPSDYTCLGYFTDLHSRQDLLSSGMLVRARKKAPTPYCLLVSGNLPYGNPLFSTTLFSSLDLSIEYYREIATSFQSMRYITLNNQRPQRSTNQGRYQVFQSDSYRNRAPSSFNCEDQASIKDDEP